MVALPPVLEANISAMMTGTGSNFSRRASSMVTVARKSMTVMLSMNMERKPERNMKVIRMGMTRYFTSLATRRHIQRKKPAAPIPSTMTIMPPMKIMVCQLTPPISGAPSEAAVGGGLCCMLCRTTSVPIDEVGQPQHLPQAVRSIVDQHENQDGCEGGADERGDVAVDLAPHDRDEHGKEDDDG